MSQESKPVEKSKSDLKFEELMKGIKELEGKMEQYKPLKTSGHEEKHHFDPLDLETTCPDCKKKIDEFKQKVGEEYAVAHGLETAQKLYKDRATHPYQCLECGVGVTEKERNDPALSCPLCGKNARTRSR